MFNFHTTHLAAEGGGSSVHFGFLRLNWPTDWWLAHGPALFDLEMVIFWALFMFWVIVA